MIKLSETEIASEIERLNDQLDVPWQLRDGKLHKVFTFNNFIEAFGFIAQIALVAEKINHHPEWSNVYKQVAVNLTTHEVDGISEKDFELAKHMEEFA